eukprot:5787619-Amphidinium_carterae.1
MRKGKGYKGRGNRRFEECIDLVEHLCNWHLGPLQQQQLDMIKEQRITVRQLVYYFFNRDILDIPCSVPMLHEIIPRHPCGQHNPALPRSPFFINPLNGVLGPEAERLKGREEEAAPLPHPIGPPVMKAPSKPSNPAPVPKMKPPPTKAPEVTVTEMVEAQSTQRPGFKPPPEGVQRPGFKPPPEGVMRPPWDRAPPANPVPSSSPADYKEVSITYLPFAPKKPPPQMPGQEQAVVPQQQVYKPPPAPGYAGLTPQQYEEAQGQAKYQRDLANRRAQANRNPDVDGRRDYGSGSASSGTQPGDRAAAAAAPCERDDGNPFSRRRTPNKMPVAYGPQPPPHTPLPPPSGVEITNMLTTPLLGVVIDVDLVHPDLFGGHLPEHPTLTHCSDVYLYNEEQFESYPYLRVFSELILLAYLRSIHVAQECLCRSRLRYPTGSSHLTHHEFSEHCEMVTRQRERIEHAFRHQWQVADCMRLNLLTGPERVLHEMLTTYLYMCWNLTIYNYDGENPPLYPLLPRKKPDQQ